jgi:hypothetical protein
MLECQLHLPEEIRAARVVVGVHRQGDKWAAGIGCHGKHHYLGIFDDEVEAAKARDRKAYELHGVHAYLNFPEDYRGRKKRKKAKEM